MRSNRRHEAIDELVGRIKSIGPQPNMGRVRDIDVADALKADGWRPPARVITDLDELQALPLGAVVRDSASDEMRKFSPREWEMFGQPGVWGEGAVELPVTVLHEPEED